MKKKIKYRIAKKEDKLAALDCLSEVFLNQEPLSKHLRVPRHSFEAFCSDLLDFCLEKSLSWIALESSTGKIAGVRLATDSTNDFKPDSLYGWEMKTILNFLDHISAIGSEKINSPSIHIHMVAVASVFQRQGIALGLLQNSAKNHVSRGYATCRGEVTSIANQILLMKFASFHEYARISYSHYQSSSGIKPFRGINSQKDCVAYSINLKEAV